jgi:hypothetical protein
MSRISKRMRRISVPLRGRPPDKTVIADMCDPEHFGYDILDYKEELLTFHNVWSAAGLQEV